MIDSNLSLYLEKIAFFSVLAFVIINISDGKKDRCKVQRYGLITFSVINVNYFLTVF